MAKLADAQDLKSCEANPSCRFDPGLRHHNHFISRGRAARLARRAHNPEVRRFKSPPRNQKTKGHRQMPFCFSDYGSDFEAIEYGEVRGERCKNSPLDCFYEASNTKQGAEGAAAPRHTATMRLLRATQIPSPQP